MNWAHLEVFLVLFQEGSVAKAAARIGVEPSTVSRRLTALEEEVGHALFLRTRNGLTPTDRASRLAPLAFEIDAKVREAAAVTAMANDRPSGLVRVAAPDLVVELFLVPHVKELLDRHVDLRIEFSSGSALTDIAGLEADLAIRFVKPDSGDLIATHLRRAELGVFVSGRDRNKAENDWSKLDWISWTRSMGPLPEARWLRDQVGAKPRLGFNRNPTILAAVRAGAGAALLPRSARRVFDDLVEIEPPEDVELPVYDMWLVKPTIHRANPAVSAVAAWIESVLGSAQTG